MSERLQFSLTNAFSSLGATAISFTPTFTNYTRGNGTSSAYYMRVNKLVYVYIREVLGSTSSVTGSIDINLPITATRYEAIETTLCRIDDSGTNTFWGVTTGATTTTASLLAQGVTFSYSAIAFTSATVPMTWATNDSFAVAFVYEAA